MHLPGLKYVLRNKNFGTQIFYPEFITNTVVHHFRALQKEIVLSFKYGTDVTDRYSRIAIKCRKSQQVPKP
jgi:hypothetical protein